MEEWEVFTNLNLTSSQELKFKEYCEDAGVQYVKVRYIPLKRYVVRATSEQLKELETLCSWINRSTKVSLNIILVEERE